MKKNLLIMIITLSLILVLGSSYAYLIYTKESNNSYVINVGTLEVTFVDSETEFLNLTNMYPMTDDEGKSLEDELVFEVKNTGNLVANYNVYIEELSTDPEFKTVIKYIVNKDNKGYSEPKILNEDKYIENNGKLKVGETSEYYVKVWLMETADNTYMNKEFKAKVIVEGNQNLDKGIPLLDTIKEAIANHTTDTCIPTITDDNGTPDNLEDDTIYFSGDNDCVNFNYVWYSGKLWRITAINSDGTIKAITEDCITAIAWGENSIYSSTTWVYQWLNEDFKDTLYNYEEIIAQNVNWNASLDGNDTPVRPPIDGNAIIVQGDIGLLNAYEYYQSYKNLNSYENSYLNNGYSWFLITKDTGVGDTHIRFVSGKGEIAHERATSDISSVRPAINFNSDVLTINENDGSKSSPYLIIGDKEKGQNGEKVNERLSGEYVNVDDKVYRIVRIENETAKLTSVDYVRDENEILTKKFTDKSTNYKEIVNNGNETYWGAYLNGTWLTDNLKKYITEGTYYLGIYPTGVSYKNTICSVSNTTESIDTCAKTTSTWQGLVGLPRVGEMFSAQLGEGYQTSSKMWLITATSGNWVVYVYGSGAMNSQDAAYFSEAARPSIYLKSEVIITGGDGMSPETAYTIGLPKSN